MGTTCGQGSYDLLYEGIPIEVFPLSLQKKQIVELLKKRYKTDNL